MIAEVDTRQHIYVNDSDNSHSFCQIVVAVSVIFTNILWAQQTPEYWKVLGLGIGPHTQKWISFCQQDKYFKLATDKEVKAGGKLEKGEDWFQALAGWVNTS